MINEEKEDVKRGREKRSCGNKAKICAKNLMDKKREQQRDIFWDWKIERRKKRREREMERNMRSRKRRSFYIHGCAGQHETVIRLVDRSPLKKFHNIHHQILVTFKMNNLAASIRDEDWGEDSGEVAPGRAKVSKIAPDRARGC